MITFEDAIVTANCRKETTGDCHSGTPLGTKTAYSVSAIEERSPYFVIVGGRASDGDMPENECRVHVFDDNDARSRTQCRPPVPGQREDRIVSDIPNAYRTMKRSEQRDGMRRTGMDRGAPVLRNRNTTRPRDGSRQGIVRTTSWTDLPMKIVGS